jgi:predicted metal-dependent peptidase
MAMHQSGHFEKARIKLILDQPFFAVLALHLIEKEMDMGHPIIQQLTMPTCGVDGQNLYVNPDFVKNLNDDEKIGLLAHEVMHVALGHIWPWRKQWRDPKKWNAAGDYVINSMLKKEGFTLPKGGLHNQKFDNMSTEEIYEKLEEEEKKTGKSPAPTWEDLLMGMDNPNAEKGKEGKSGKSSAELAELEQEWKERLVEAAHVAKLKGKLPAGMERFVDDLVKPHVPWYALLDQYVNEIMRDDYNELIHDRRYVQYGIYLPDMYSEGCEVYVAVDTSGSIGPDEIKVFVGEVVGILRSRNVKSVRIFACDAEIHLDETIGPWDPLPTDYPGGGGTSFAPVFDKIDEDGKRPACLIYLTDTFGDFPEDKPNYPVLWAGMTEDPKLPWGTYIRFDPKEDVCEISAVEES